jgi:hypothetical protein
MKESTTIAFLSFDDFIETLKIFSYERELFAYMKDKKDLYKDYSL